MRHTFLSLAVIAAAIVFAACIRDEDKPPANANSGSTAVASLNEGRVFHEAVLTTSGAVVVFGGRNASGQATDSVESYNGTTFTTLGAMLDARFDFTAVALPNGNIFIAGGNDGSGNSLNTTEIYNPTSGTSTAGPNLGTGRYGHVALVFTNGQGQTQVALCGGLNANGGLTALLDWEFYDVGSNSMGTGGNMADYAFFAEGFTGTAMGLASGFSVTQAGAIETHGVQVFTGTSGSFASFNFSPNWASAPAAFGASGLLYVAGGTDAGQVSRNNSIQSFNPANNAVATVAAPLTVARSGMTATTVSNGSVVFIGGFDGSSAASTIDFFDGTSIDTTVLNQARFGHTATLLTSGDILVVGGSDGGAALASVELVSGSGPGGGGGGGSGCTQSVPAPPTSAPATPAGTTTQIWSEDFSTTPPPNAINSVQFSTVDYEFGNLATAPTIDIAATGLTACYDDNELYSLEFINIDLSNATGSAVFVCQLYYDVDPGDIATIWTEIPTGSGNFEPATMTANSQLTYNVSVLGGGNDSFDGTATGWITVEVDLSTAVGGQVLVTFDLVGDAAGTNAGGLFIKSAAVYD